MKRFVTDMPCDLYHLQCYLAGGAPLPFPLAVRMGADAEAAFAASWADATAYDRLYFATDVLDGDLVRRALVALMEPVATELPRAWRRTWRLLARAAARGTQWSRRAFPWWRRRPRDGAMRVLECLSDALVDLGAAEDFFSAWALWRAQPTRYRPVRHGRGTCMVVVRPQAMSIESANAALRAAFEAVLPPPAWPDLAQCRRPA